MGNNSYQPWLLPVRLTKKNARRVCSTQHLPWRTRLTAVTCYAYEDAGDINAAAKCAAHAMEKVRLDIYIQQQLGLVRNRIEYGVCVLHNKSFFLRVDIYIAYPVSVLILHAREVQALRS